MTVKAHFRERWCSKCLFFLQVLRCGCRSSKDLTRGTRMRTRNDQEIGNDETERGTVGRVSVDCDGCKIKKNYDIGQIRKFLLEISALIR